MAGLIQQNMQQQQPMQPAMQGGMQGGGDYLPGDMDDDLTPEDARALDAAQKYIMDALYKNGGAEALAQKIAAAPDPIEGLAMSAYDTSELVMERMGDQIDGDLAFIVALIVFSELAEIVSSSGFQLTGADMAKAISMMIERLSSEGGANPQEVQQLLSTINPEQMGAAIEAQIAEDSKGGQEEQGAM